MKERNERRKRGNCTMTGRERKKGEEKEKQKERIEKREKISVWEADWREKKKRE